MINNRQNGRRRGRGGPQVRNGSGNGGPERGNRIDNRARGNAAQLHEKYRNLARDMQTQGDRVMTEYYLQFADHYFRVLSEGRARFEEQNPNQNQQRRQYSQNDDFDGEGFDGEGNASEDGIDGDAQREQRPFDREPRRQTAYEDGEGQHQPRDNRDGRENGQRDGNRNNNNNRDYAGRGEQRPPRQPYQPREAEPRAEQSPVASPFVEGVEGEPVRPRRGRPPRRVDAGGPNRAVNGEAHEAQPTQIEIDRLPPAFAPSEPITEQAEAAAPTRGRRRAAKPAEGEVRGVEGEPVAEAAPRRRRVRRDEPDDSNVAA